jgi:hypothetical protein
MSKLLLVRIVFVGLTVLVVLLILGQMEIDACLDGGGSFNYAFSKCEVSGNAGYIPVLKREHWYVPIIFADLVAGVGMFLVYKLAVWLLPPSWKGGFDNGAI